MRRLLTLTFLLQTVVVFGQSGVIEGHIIDKDTKEPLFGAAVILEGTTVGAMADMDGKFTIENIKQGNYNVLGSYISYETQKTENVTVGASDTLRINFELESRYNMLKGVGIVAKANRETETALLIDRRNAIVSTQSIGALELSRKGIGDAQSAVSSVAGVSKQEGVKNIFVRGLGDRYNATLLNGLPVPSEDPEYKNIALSIFDADIIKNIGVEKVFAAPYSGDAGGAIVNISSKELTDDFELDISVSGGFNTNTIGSTFYKPDGANNLGFSLANRPQPGQYSFANSLDPMAVSVKLDQSIRLAGGKRFQIGNNALNLYVVASHSADNKSREEIVRNTTSNGTIYQDQVGRKYENSINQLILTNLEYDLNHKHSIAYNFMMLHATKQYVGDYFGTHTEIFQNAHNNQGFFRRQQINDNLLFTHQLLSRWKLNEKLDLKADFSLNTIRGLEPDRRENYLSQREDGSFGLTGSNRQRRFFSEMNETDYNMKLAASYAITDRVGSENSNVSIGFQGQISHNDFEAVEYNFQQIPGNIPLANLTLDNFYNASNYYDGVFKMSEGHPNSYQVSRINQSVFAESNYQFTNALSANIGFRVDFVNLEIAYDVPGQMGQNNIVNPYYLPSLNLKYDLDTKNSLRLGASKTYTLPQFKEISPFQYVNISFASEGNPNLLPSDNYNIDLRWDNFMSASELLSATLFYKHIVNPIGRVDKGNSAGLLTYDNISDAADVMGLEMEFRKNILARSSADDQVQNRLSLGTNASYILTSTNLKLTNTPERNSSLEGASPLLINSDITYTHLKNGKEFTTSLVLSYFGDRIHTIGTMGYADIVEEGTATLNWVSNYKFSDKMGVGLRVANILDSPIELTRRISNSDENITLSKYRYGINFSIGFNYAF